MKNKVFRRRYVIEFKGVTTNNFMVKLLDDTFTGLVDAIKGQHKQTKVEKFEIKDLKEGKK